MEYRPSRDGADMEGRVYNSRAVPRFDNEGLQPARPASQPLAGSRVQKMDSLGPKELEVGDQDGPVDGNSGSSDERQSFLLRQLSDGSTASESYAGPTRFLRLTYVRAKRSSGAWTHTHRLGPSFGPIVWGDMKGKPSRKPTGPTGRRKRMTTATAVANDTA